MSTDYLTGKCVGSRITADSSMGKYLPVGFSIIRISAVHLGFEPYVLFRFDIHIPVIFLRHRFPQA